MSTARRQSSSDCPGTPNIRSIDTLSKPAARAARRQAGPAAASWLRPSAPQQPVVEGLHADRQPVDAVAAQRAQVRFVGLARVDLDGDLQRARVGRRRTPRAPPRSRARAHPAATGPACRRRSRSTRAAPRRRTSPGAPRSRRRPRRRRRREERRCAYRRRSRSTDSARRRTGSERRHPAARPSAARRAATSRITTSL